MNGLEEQSGEWEQVIEYFTEYVLHTIEDGKYDPENEDTPEFHPGTKRNLKSKIKKFISDFFNTLDYTSEYATQFREALLTVDRCHIRKMRIYRDQTKKMKDMEKKLLAVPETRMSLEQLLEVKEDEIKERYAEKLALGERNRQRVNKQMERINQLNKIVDEYEQNYVSRVAYNELRDNVVTDTLEAKQELERAQKKKIKKDSTKEDKKKKKMKALKKKIKKLQELTSSDSDSSDSDSDVETLHYSVGSSSD